MLIKLIVIGKVKDKRLLHKIEEFQKWIGVHAKIAILEIKDCGKVAENKKLLDTLEREKGHIFVLDELGSQFTSEEFAAHIGKIDQKMIFVIGGPDGTTKELQTKANTLLTLSKMTFTHEMARLFLTEQLYRAISILKGGKYHRG